MVLFAAARSSATASMRQGIAFLALTAAAIYLSSGCLDYARVWTNAPERPARAPTDVKRQPRYKDEVLPHLVACGERALWKMGGTTAVILGLYLASGWALDRTGRHDESAL